VGVEAHQRARRDRTPAEEQRFEVRRGSVRLALRAADPNGRAPWAMRLLDNRSVIERPGRPA